MEPLVLGFGLVLGILFVLVLLFFVLPEADHIVKKTYGIIEAVLITRVFCLCICLPLYVFTIIMIVATLASDSKANSLIEQICPDDLSCSSAFALGREKFDKTHCVDFSCSPEELDARSGSQPLKFPRLGLAEPLEPELFNSTYACVSFNSTSNACDTYSKTVDGDTSSDCQCLTFDAATGICLKLVGCDGDVDKSVHATTCLETDSVTGTCANWFVSTDSKQQFSFKSCSCLAESSDICSSFACQELIMQYVYPNTLLSLLTAVLFILPLVLTFWTLIKSQLKKVIKCNEVEIRVFSQEAGAIEGEDVAENLANGGFGSTQKVGTKTKQKTLRFKTVVAIVLSGVLAGLFIWMNVVVSGRVGLALGVLPIVSVAAWEMYKHITFLRNRCDRTKEKVEYNAGQDATYA